MLNPISRNVVKVPCIMFLGLTLAAATVHAQPAPVGDVMTLYAMPDTSRNVHIRDLEFFDDGSFVVVWSDSSSDAAAAGLFFRVFGQSGTPQSDIVMIAHAFRGRAAATSSTFMVVWEDLGPNDHLEVFARVYSKTGGPQTDVISVTPAGAFISGTQTSRSTARAST